MKAVITERNFSPISITITIETLEEYQTLCRTYIDERETGGPFTDNEKTIHSTLSYTIFKVLDNEI